MRSLTITEHGGPDVLEVREYPDPDPGPGELTIEVRACGFNFAELMARQGLYPDAPDPPCVMGYEAAGVVTEVGEDVDRFDPGDRVIAAVRFGAHSDTILATEDQVYPMPESMSFEEAAALPVNFLTAYHMLFHVAHLKPGDWLLIHMAAGGVGTAVLQLAQTVENVTVFGTASSRKHDILELFGCDHPIDYRSNDYEEEIRRLGADRGLDVVLDPLGGKDWEKGYRLLRPVGRLVAYGFANMSSGDKKSWWNMLWQYFSVPEWSPMELMPDNKTVAGVNMNHLWDRMELLRKEMDALLDLYQDGTISPSIDSTFTFSEAPEAHRRMQNRENIGKIVLLPD